LGVTRRRAPAKKLRRPARRSVPAVPQKGPRTARGDRRRAAIIQAATEEFLTHGYEGVSLRQILRRGGGSSDTLYKFFGDKEGLFVACAIELCGQFMMNYALGSQGRSPQAELVAFGMAFLKNLLMPRNVGIYRLMVAEVNRFPGLGRTVLAAGHDRVAKELAEYLRKQTRRGEFAIKNCELAALQYIDMIHGGCHWRPLLLAGPMPSKEELEECVETAARVFCRGYGPG
jgi:AcrR family transcriptional regulator